MSFRLNELPTAMRDLGLEVVEVAGCYGRGRAFDQPPGASVDHWTVGAAAGEVPSLATVVYGDSSRNLPGPLCHVLRGRRRPGHARPRAYFVADGVANHAGAGRFVNVAGRVITGNSGLCGLEVEYRPYDEPITDADLEVDATVHAAFAQVCGFSSADVVGHWQYATPAGRKVDRRTVSTSLLRDLTARALHDRIGDDDLMCTPYEAADARAKVNRAYEAIAERSPTDDEAAPWVWAIVEHGVDGEKVVGDLRQQLIVELLVKQRHARQQLRDNLKVYVDESIKAAAVGAGLSAESMAAFVDEVADNLARRLTGQ